MQAIIDSGNNLPETVISSEAYNALKRAGVIRSELEQTSITAKSADSNEIKVLGEIRGNFTLYLGKGNATRIEKLIVIENLQHAMNIGSHLLQKLNAILDFGQNVLQIGTTQIPLLKPKQKPSVKVFRDSPGHCTAPGGYIASNTCERSVVTTVQTL